MDYGGDALGAERRPEKGNSEQPNPYDWSTTAAQLKNADIPVGAYIKTGSGKVRKVRADEIKWAKNEARRKGISGKAAAPEAKPAAAHPPEPPVFREDFETADSGGAVAESEEDTTPGRRNRNRTAMPPAEAGRRSRARFQTAQGRRRRNSHNRDFTRVTLSRGR